MALTSSKVSSRPNADYLVKRIAQCTPGTHCVNALLTAAEMKNNKIWGCRSRMLLVLVGGILTTIHGVHSGLHTFFLILVTMRARSLEF